MRLLQPSIIRHGHGFTIVELIVAVGIVLLLAGLTVPLAGGLFRAPAAESVARELAGAFELGREQSRVGLLSVGHGLLFTPSAGDAEYVLFMGNDYPTRVVARDVTVTIPNSLNLSTNFPGNELFFPAGSSRPVSVGWVEITTTIGQGARVAIDADGLIEVSDL